MTAQTFTNTTEIVDNRGTLLFYGVLHIKKNMLEKMNMFITDCSPLTLCIEALTGSGLLVQYDNLFQLPSCQLATWLQEQLVAS